MKKIVALLVLLIGGIIHAHRHGGHYHSHGGWGRHSGWRSSYGWGRPYYEPYNHYYYDNSFFGFSLGAALAAPRRKVVYVEREDNSDTYSERTREEIRDLKRELRRAKEDVKKDLKELEEEL